MAQIDEELGAKRWKTISLRPEVRLKLSKIMNNINSEELENNKPKSSISSIIDQALTVFESHLKTSSNFLL